MHVHTLHMLGRSTHTPLVVGMEHDILRPLCLFLSFFFFVFGLDSPSFLNLGSPPGLHSTLLHYALRLVAGVDPQG